MTGDDVRQVTVVVVSWDSASFLAACLESLAAQSLRPRHVVVVDNGSTDGSAPLARGLGAEVIENGENLGFCRASNQGWASAVGGAVLFLNPDVVLEPSYLEEACGVMTHRPRVGMVAGKLLRFDGETLDTTGQFLARSRRTLERGYGRRDEGQFESEGAVFSVCGAAALYRRRALQELELDGQIFDEDFFAFHEDLDLGWRAQRLGWEGWYTPRARGRHFRGSTDASRRAGGNRRRLTSLSDDLAYHAVKNRYLAMIKNDSAGGLLRDLPFVLAREVLLWGYLILRRPRVAWRVATDRRSRRRAWGHRRVMATQRRATTPARVSP